jgi:Na+-driven multidrug efflux pump
VFVFLGVARSSYLINEGFTSFDLLATATDATLNVVLNLFLIPEYGAHGAVVSTVISQAVSAFVRSFLWVRANGPSSPPAMSSDLLGGPLGFRSPPARVSKKVFLTRPW